MPAVIWPNGSTTRPTVTSPYGPRTHPVTGAPATFHYGIDLVGFATVLAPCDGVITLARYNGGAGNEGRIERPNGDSCRLMHHAVLYVREGQAVRQGDPIGLMGTTGNSTGVHSHEEWRDRNWNPIEPNAYMAAANAASPAGTGTTTTLSEEDEMHESKTYTADQGLDGGNWPIQVSKNEHRFAATGPGQKEQGLIVFDLIFSGVAGDAPAAFVQAVYEEKRNGKWVQIATRDAVLVSGRGQYVDGYEFSGDVRGRLFVDSVRDGVVLKRVAYRKSYTRA